MAWYTGCLPGFSEAADCKCQPNMSDDTGGCRRRRNFVCLAQWDSSAETPSGAGQRQSKTEDPGIQSVWFNLVVVDYGAKPSICNYTR